MDNLSISQSAFKAWVSSHVVGEVLGYARCAPKCPLAVYLNEIMPIKGPWWVTPFMATPADGEGLPEKLPPWARAFAIGVDKFEGYQPPVTPAYALGILDEVEAPTNG